MPEVAYITLQGARGRASHFNFETALESVLYYALMGGAALVMMAATLAVGLWVWRYPDRDRGPGLRLGALLGPVVGSVATLIVTAPLAAAAIDGPGPWVGGMRSNAAGLSITGWSTTGGDLRVPHFFAAHMARHFRSPDGLPIGTSLLPGGLWSSGPRSVSVCLPSWSPSGGRRRVFRCSPPERPVVTGR